MDDTPAIASEFKQIWVISYHRSHIKGEETPEVPAGHIKTQQ